MKNNKNSFNDNSIKKRKRNVIRIQNIVKNMEKVLVCREISGYGVREKKAEIIRERRRKFCLKLSEFNKTVTNRDTHTSFPPS